LHYAVKTSFDIARLILFCTDSNLNQAEFTRWINQTDFKSQNVLHKVCKRGLSEIQNGKSLSEDVKKIIEMLKWFGVKEDVFDVNNNTPAEMMEKMQ